MSHLTPEQFVDLAEGARPETSMPHLASCDTCRRQLADVRAMMPDAATADVPEPSPLFWAHLSARVNEAVAAEAGRSMSWRERLLRPYVLVPSLLGVMAVAVIALLLPGTFTPATIPAKQLPMSANTAMLLSLPPLAPLGAADDPQLGLVAGYGTTLDWDEMRDEIALAPPASSSDAVIGALTADEQRELQRLLAEEMAQPSALEIRS